jgi:hypothetical protein
MAELEKIPGLLRLRERTRGHARVCVAVLDGPVDLEHPCLNGADLKVLSRNGPVWDDARFRHSPIAIPRIFRPSCRDKS